MKFYELERDFRGISRRILKFYWIWLDNFTNIREIVKKNLIFISVSTIVLKVFIIPTDQLTTVYKINPFIIIFIPPNIE